MTNKYKYFVANWKMFGDIKTINSINKVIKISKSRKFNKAKIIYCPPYTLLDILVKRLKKTMTVDNLIKKGSGILRKQNISSHQIDSELLLSKIISFLYTGK